jgi:perosamine synthetase
MLSEFINLVRRYYKAGTEEFISLHAPIFNGNEINYITDTIKSTFVSSVGPYVDRFEAMIRDTTGSKYAIATVNGTSALHVALYSLGVGIGDAVITQALSFVATTNAIQYTGANPIFLDVDLDSMSLSPVALESFLIDECERKEEKIIHRTSGFQVKAVVPTHTYGNPGRVKELKSIANTWGLYLVEDSAESLGSYVDGKHTGTFGTIGIFSFNGNKTITSGGGGVLVTDDDSLGKRLKHITTTAKVPHPWEFFHDELGFNYRMPNLNASLACAQLEQLEIFLKEKRRLSELYQNFFEKTYVSFKVELENTKSNYWLNTIELPSKYERDLFLEETNTNRIMTRPTWNLLNTLPMYSKCITDRLENSIFLSERLVNIPSGVPWKK